MIGTVVIKGRLSGLFSIINKVPSLSRFLAHTHTLSLAQPHCTHSLSVSLSLNTLSVSITLSLLICEKEREIERDSVCWLFVNYLALTEKIDEVDDKLGAVHLPWLSVEVGPGHKVSQADLNQGMQQRKLESWRTVGKILTG